MEEVMTKLALIAPISMLGLTERTDYQLALPHLIETNSTYRRHYIELGRDPQQYIIMDNGEAEGQNNFSHAQLLQLANMIGADEVVAPDTMKDSADTIRRSDAFLKWYSDIFGAVAIPVGIVLQGETYQELLDTLTHFVNSEYVNMIKTFYLPRHLIDTLSNEEPNPLARIEVAEKFEPILRAGKFDLHFLGANSHASYEAYDLARAVPWVRGIDTSMPYNYALANKAVTSSLAINRPDNYFELFPTRAQHQLAKDNTEVMISWLNGSTRSPSAKTAPSSE